MFVMSLVPRNYYRLGDDIPAASLGRVATWEDLADEERFENKLFAVQLKPEEGQVGDKYAACVAGGEIFFTKEESDMVVIALSPKHAYTVPVGSVFHVPEEFKLFRDFHEEIGDIVDERNAIRTERRADRRAARNTV
jgi:hypothetical protein